MHREGRAESGVTERVEIWVATIGGHR